MRQFASSGFRLWNLSREAKVIYTFFCGLSLLAIASSLMLYEDLVGPSLSGQHLTRVRAYYSDSAASSTPTEKPAEKPAAMPSPNGGGPDIALPAEAEAESAQGAGRLTVTMPYRKLLEVTHFHLFTVPVFLLILTHLFMLTALQPRWKMIHIAAGWIAGTLHILTPWLIRFAGPSLSSLFPLSGGAFLVTSLILCLYPLYVMWQKPAKDRSRAESDVKTDS